LPDKLIRTRAASSILVALAIGGAVQLLADSSENPVELVEQAQEPADGAVAESSTTAGDPETTEAVEEEPFVYKVGLLDGVTTSNFWAYFGSAPTVWDAYVLAPTKAS
jgi:hypothetical protein